MSLEVSTNTIMKIEKGDGKGGIRMRTEYRKGRDDDYWLRAEQDSSLEMFKQSHLYFFVLMIAN